MGHRMEIYVRPEAAEKVMAIAAEFGIESRIIGRVEDADSNHLTIKSSAGTFEY